MAALPTWLTPIDGKVLIAGPCSAESPEQVLATARSLADSGQVSIFRSGIWKPRTRPNSFEGMGVPALAWLKTVQQETGLKTAVEVANREHAEAALEAGVDILWIGARTTVNPFSVQEIADALRGVDVPVLVKNPINPDLQLWLGAVERLENAGLTRLGVIHRGFSSFGNSIYRNDPKWDLAIDFKRLRPDLPMICDPSHISGKRELVAAVAQRALDLQMEGLMIEVHPDPDAAWSDPKQQLTPDAFAALAAQLVVRSAENTDYSYEQQLTALREQINLLDKELIRVLADRMKVVDGIGHLKKNNNVTILQINRWDEIVKDRIAQAREQGLATSFVDEVLKAVHLYSISRQNEIMNAVQGE